MNESEYGIYFIVVQQKRLVEKYTYNSMIEAVTCHSFLKMLGPITQ